MIRLTVHSSFYVSGAMQILSRRLTFSNILINTNRPVCIRDIVKITRIHSTRQVMITRSGDNILRNSTINHLATVSEDSLRLFIQLHAQFECL